MKIKISWPRHPHTPARSAAQPAQHGARTGSTRSDHSAVAPAAAQETTDTQQRSRTTRNKIPQRSTQTPNTTPHRHTRSLTHVAPTATGCPANNHSTHSTQQTDKPMGIVHSTPGQHRAQRLLHSPNNTQITDASRTQAHAPPHTRGSSQRQPQHVHQRKNKHTHTHLGCALSVSSSWLGPTNRCKPAYAQAQQTGNRGIRSRSLASWPITNKRNHTHTTHEPFRAAAITHTPISVTHDVYPNLRVDVSKQKKITHNT